MKLVNNEQLKNIRKQLDMTAKQLAEILGVPVRTYEGWEGGRNIPPLAIRAIGMLLWMDKGSRETYINYLKSENNKG